MNSPDIMQFIKKRSRYWVGGLKLVFAILLLIHSCARVPTTESWRQQYSHLGQSFPDNDTITETDYYSIFLVTARHLDYWDTEELAKSLVRFRRGKGDIGHSWVYLKGIKDGRTFTLEGGQSWRLGKNQPGFFNGVKNYIQNGYANPTEARKRNPRYESNPIKYLWDESCTGFFQKGSGGFRPTFAAKFDLTKRKFEQILDYIDPKRYPFECSSLVGNQCSSFVARLALMAGISLRHQVTLKCERRIRVGNQEYRLWADPRYSKITFSTPDVLERSLMEAVARGEAEYALGWYLKRKSL